MACKEKLLRVWVCPKESKSFLCSLGFCFGIEVVKNSEWACVFCNAVIGGGGFAPHISTVQNTRAHSEFLTISIPKQNPRYFQFFAKIKSAKLKVSRFLLVYSLKLVYLTKPVPWWLKVNKSQDLMFYMSLSAGPRPPRVVREVFPPPCRSRNF